MATLWVIVKFCDEIIESNIDVIDVNYEQYFFCKTIIVLNLIKGL